MVTLSVTFNVFTVDHKFEHRNYEAHSNNFTNCCLQLGRQVAWWIVFVANDIIALVDSLKQSKGISNTEDCRQTSSQQLAHWRPRIFCDLTSQLTYQFLLALFNIRLPVHNNTMATKLKSQDSNTLLYYRTQQISLTNHW